MSTYVNGNKKLEVGDAVLSRASAAFSPDDGRAYPNNAPRVASNRIAWNNWKPRVFGSHSGSETELTYASYLTFLSSWESANVGAGKFTKITLGASFQSRDVFAYRLGPVDTKHFVVVGTSHGNEHDGIKGIFTAMTLLRTLAELGRFRNEWTIFFVPVLNPDGYSANTHNLAHVGPNSQTVNLDRNFDWFWSEYVEGSTESKGSAPESEIEALNLLNYFRTGNSGGPVTFGFLMDFHGNTSPGARYQSRDRCWQKITNSQSWPTVPGSSLELDIHMQIWKMARGLQTLRERDEGGPNLMTRGLHSRFYPALAGYFNSQGVPSMTVEEVKVTTATASTETFKTACDFRMDYVLAGAFALTSSSWETEDAILLEPAATNSIPNASMRTWGAGPLPSNFYSSRMTIARNHLGENRLYQIGESISLTAYLTDNLQVTAEYTRIAPLTTNRAAVLVPADKSVYHIDVLGIPGTQGTLTRNEVYGLGLAYAATSSKVDAIGGGTAAPSTGAVTTVTRLTVADGVFSQVNVGNLNTARMFHAVASNFLADGADVDIRAWCFGGFNGAGARLSSIERWNPNTNTSTNMTAVLAATTAEAVAVYYPPTSKIYVFGGRTAGGVVSTIYEYTPATDIISTHGTSMTVGLASAAAAYCPGTRKIYLMSGETNAGTMSGVVYSFDPATGVYATESILTQLDNEDEDNGVTRPWNTAIGRNSACTLREEVGMDGKLIMPGGRLTSTVGALTDAVYFLDPVEGIQGKISDLGHGFLRSSSVLSDTRMTSFYTDAFSSLAGWTDAAGAFFINAGAAEGVDGTSGWVISNTDPTLKEERFFVDVATTLLSGVLPDFRLACRSAFLANAITDGYVVRYSDNGTNQIWHLERYNASVLTVVSTQVDVTASPTLQFTSTAFRTLQFRVEEASPVHLTVIFNGSTIFDSYDFSASRISSLGKMAFFGGSS